MRKHPVMHKTIMHNGVDLAATIETVFSMFPGVVKNVSQDSRSGKYVIIQTGNYTISYCHLSYQAVLVGQIVKAGTPIGVAGCSGLATGIHLHLIATDDNMQQTMDVSCVAKRFSIIIENSEIAPKDLVLKMNAPWNNKQNVTVEIIDSLPIELFQAAKSIDCELSSYLLEIASNYLQSLSQEEWTDSLLEDNSFNIQLLKLHHTNKVQPFFDALKDILKKYANGSSDSCFTKDKLAILVGIAEELQHEIKKLFLDIRDIFLSSSITTEKLILYGDWLFKYGNLSQKIGCLEKILPSEIIDDNMIIRMLYEHKEIVKGMVDHSQDPSEFLDKLKAMALGNRKDDESLADLCKYLCIFKESSRKDKK